MEKDTQVEMLPSGGKYQCFHCLTMGVIWDNDFTFEDAGYEGEGLIHELHCANCGAIITYMIPMEDENEQTTEN